MCVRVGVRVCVLEWAFMWVLWGLSWTCVREGVLGYVLGWAFMCVRLGVHVNVVGWAFIYMCYGGCSCVCVLGWVLMYVY